VVVPSLKVTVPEGVPVAPIAALTVAVKITSCPAGAVRALEVRATLLPTLLLVLRLAPGEEPEASPKVWLLPLVLEAEEVELPPSGEASVPRGWPAVLLVLPVIGLAPLGPVTSRPVPEAVLPAAPPLGAPGGLATGVLGEAGPVLLPAAALPAVPPALSLPDGADAEGVPFGWPEGSQKLARPLSGSSPLGNPAPVPAGAAKADWPLELSEEPCWPAQAKTASRLAGSVAGSISAGASAAGLPAGGVTVTCANSCQLIRPDHAGADCCS
jgi:hypothetical protein